MLSAARAQSAGQSLLVSGDARCVPWRPASIDADFMSFTLELCTPDEIRAVLPEVRRVLKPRGRFGVVSLSAEETVPVEAYDRLHSRFPAWIDCRPIAVVDVRGGNGFQTRRTCRVEMWRLPFVAAVAESEPAHE